ncbi:DUF885 family protein [Candidatus Cyanaurora vandensis]|uniref:DUF885 domain-containing protein n=1 Tax=Candidatus Cyanaurora vandensis TaxID=2714958 RepID=UPI00257B5061|nr:DUF885 domain-containing protein [Candidatus Cyanaurora vandensis]
MLQKNRLLTVLGAVTLWSVPPVLAQTLDSFFTKEWAYQLAQDPVEASTLGERRYNDRWQDLSLKAVQNRHAHDRAVLKELQGFNRAELPIADQLNYDLFEREYQLKVAEFAYGGYRIPLNQRGGIQTAHELADLLQFNTVKDYEDWLNRLRRFPVYMDQTLGLMQEGVRTRTLLPSVVMARVPAQVDQQLVPTPEASPFYKPFRSFPKDIPPPEQARLQQAAKTAIQTRILPSYRKLKTFLVQKYLPASFASVGVWQIPNGDKFYTLLARKYTTTAMTPAQIHELGLAEVKRIRGEMDTVIQKVGFKGTFAEFLTFLRTDQRFYYQTPEELLTSYRAMSRRIDPGLVTLFKTLPRMPYAIEPIPAAAAPDTTTAYYQQPAAGGSRAGIYYVNLYKPESRPKYEMMALSLHEAVPGHHLQIALAQELGEIPNFRRYGGYTAFIEGWGLYAESLGEDLGLYIDPYDKFGQLTYEMWRAVRLVVDTGLHHYRWDRQKAIDYFLANAAKQKLDVINEIDRYLVMPGQALAYKIGERKIQELRTRARSRLGDKFDIREFHGVVLGSGAVPLDILERNVDNWLAAR